MAAYSHELGHVDDHVACAHRTPDMTLCVDGQRGELLCGHEAVIVATRLSLWRGELAGWSVSQYLDCALRA